MQKEMRISVMFLTMLDFQQKRPNSLRSAAGSRYWETDRLPGCWQRVAWRSSEVNFT